MTRTKKLVLFSICFFFFNFLHSQAQNLNEIHNDQKRFLESIQNYSTGLFYKFRKEYKNAIEYFEKAIKGNAEFYRIYSEIAECYYRLGDVKKAEYYAMRSIEEKQDFVPAYTVLYETYVKLKNYTAASEVIETLLKKKPNIVKAHFLLGQLYYSKIGDDKKAAEHFEKVVSISKENVIEPMYVEYSLYYLGYLNYKIGKVEKAVEYLKSAISVNERNRIARELLIDILMGNYSIDEAEKQIRIYFSIFQEDAKMHSYLGRIYYLRNDMRSISHLRKGSELTNNEGLLSKALLMEMIGQGNDAEEILKAFSKKHKDHICPHLALAKIYESKRDYHLAIAEYLTAAVKFYYASLYDEAIRMFSKVLLYRDGIAEVYTYLGKIYEEKEMIPVAILYYKKSHELQPNNKLLSHMGYLHFTMKNYSDALKCLDMAIAIEPLDSQSHFLKGITYSHVGNYRKAELSFRKALDLKEDDLYFYYLASVQEKQNKIRDTIKSLKRAIGLNPNNARAYNYLGYLYADRNIKLDESVKLIKRALEIEPENGAYLDSLGWAYFRQKKYKEALELLHRAEKNLDKEGISDPVVYDHIGDVYHKLGQKQEALKYWEKAYKVNKSLEIKRKIERNAGK